MGGATPLMDPWADSRKPSRRRRRRDRRIVLRVGAYRVGKECGGRWFLGLGRGYWDGWRNMFRMDLGFRRFARGWAFGPLMVWKAGR